MSCVSQSVSNSQTLAEDTIYSMSPPSDGSSITITESTVWGDDASLDGSVSIANGAILDVTANISIAFNSSINVQSGGTLNLDQGSLWSENTPAWLQMSDFNSSLTIPLDGSSGSLTVKVDFTQSFNDTQPYNDSEPWVSVWLGNEDSVNVSGNSIDVTTESDGNDSIVLNLNANGFYSWVVIDEITIAQSTGSEKVGDLWSLEKNNLLFTGFSSWGLDVEQGGVLSITNSTIRGVDLNCDGDISIIDSAISRFDHLEIGSTGSIDVIRSNLSGSIDDEDIEAKVGANVSWDEESTGSGGVVDRYTIILPQQTITTPLPLTEVDFAGLGYNNVSGTYSSDLAGNIQLPNNRIVAWMDSDGNHHTDQASVQSVVFDGVTESWGVFYSNQTIPFSLGLNPTVNLGLNLPLVQVTKVEFVESVDEVDTNQPVKMKVTVSNSGASASIRLACKVNEIDANTNPLTIPIEVAANSENTAEFYWTYTSEGSAQLNCNPLLPSAFKDFSDLVMEVSDEEATTTFVAPIEADEGGIVTIMLIAIVIVVIGVIFAAGKIGRSTPTISPDEKEHISDEEIEEVEEDTDED